MLMPFMLLVIVYAKKPAYSPIRRLELLASRYLRRCAVFGDERELGFGFAFQLSCVARRTPFIEFIIGAAFLYCARNRGTILSTAVVLTFSARLHFAVLSLTRR